MPATTLYFVRHGETDYNRNSIVQGRGVDAPLNERGRRQAEALARRFAAVPLDAIYASPLRRALETAEAVRRYHPDVPFFQVVDLEEMDWGELEGNPTRLLMTRRSGPSTNAGGPATTTTRYPAVSPSWTCSAARCGRWKPS